MKRVTLDVQVVCIVADDTEPNAITFDGIENAVPQVDGQSVGTVESFTTQEYFGE